MNVNKVINDFTGRNGPTILQKRKLARVKDEIKLLKAKIQTKKFEANTELENLKMKERILELQILKVFTVVCRNQFKKTKK